MQWHRFKLGEHRDTIMEITLVLLIVALAFFLRTYWAVGPSIQYGYSVSGGSDSYYHEKIIFHILDSKHQLIHDPMLNYPIGVNNPRPPFFHWAIVLFSYIFYPFMGSHDAAVLMLILFPAIWGSLTVIPVYLLGKEAFNKKIGILSALILAIMPAHLMRSVATQADWDAFDLFFISLSFYFFLRALKTVQYKKWIDDWFKVQKVKDGLGSFFRENKKPVIYAALSGTAMGSLALAWKGFTYAEAILLIYLFFQIFINRFRNKSNLHIVVITLIFTMFMFGLSAPWYVVTGRTGQWFGVPLLLMLSILLIGIFLEVTGKYPWTFVFGATALLIGVGLLIINIFLPDIWALIMSGQGYFVKSKLYSTIAEAQPATMGTLAMSFGVSIFILGFGGIIYLFYLIKKHREEYYLFFVFYSLIAIYMAISAARFIFNASPAFALTSAIALAWLLDLLKLRDAVKEFKGYGRGLKKSFKKAVKFSHIAGILFIAFLVILPNVWSAVDAGIPYETKRNFDKQIYNLMPSIMRPNESTYKSSSPWYLGGFGFSLPKESYPWPRAWKWLSEQDNSSPPEDRPAFVSWWDYGFECVREGEHPTVADNFQNGYQIAAQIITAQNESEVVSLFIARLLDGEFKNGHLSERAMNTLREYLGNDEANKIEDIMREPSKYREIVLNNPDKYGYYSSDISDVNTKYAAIKGTLSYLPKEKLIDLYDAIRNETGKDIRYFATDYRLFPFSGRNTGIFYAPAKLGDRRVQQYGGTVVPYDFYTLKAVDSYGNEYDLDKIPANVRIVDYKIDYKPMFYHSMLYKTFVGYSGSDVGQSQGIPGLSSNLRYYYPMQGWNMTHFKLVYRTAYWNPYKDYQNHTKDWKAIPIQLALKYQKEKNGTVELNPPAYQALPNDVVMVKFYEGAIIEGNITLSTGTPLPHVRVTILDEYGIPHATTFTDANGHYRLDAVAGNLTLVVSTNGKLNRLMMTEKTLLYKSEINVSEDQAMRLKPNYFIHKNVMIKPANLDGIVYYDTNGNNKLDSSDVRVQDTTLILNNKTYGYENITHITDGNYQIRDIAPHTYTISLIINGKEFPNMGNVSFNAGQNLTKDIPLQPSYITGHVTYSNGTLAPNATVDLIGLHARYTSQTNESGEYRVMVVPDNYTLDAHLGSYYSEKGTVVVYKWNYTTSYNITLRNGFALTGTVKYNGMEVKNAVVKITNELSPYTTYIKITGENGTFKINAPGSIYTIYILAYVNGERFTYFNNINLNENLNINITLTKAYRIDGFATGKNISEIEISVFSGNKFYRGFCNASGYYEMYLPAGKYSIGFVGFDNNQTPYFNREIITLTKDKRMDVVLHKGYNITGYVYYDKNNNGIVDENETINNGLIMLEDSHGFYEVRNIPPSGKFTLGTNINYKIKSLFWGYQQIGISHGNITIVPEKVMVRGYIYRDGNLNDIPVNITFVSENHEYKVSNITSSYSVTLDPGEYSIHISGYNRKYSIQSHPLNVNLGFEKIIYNLNFTAFAHVTVISQATSVKWYNNGKLVKEGKDIDIPIGNYTLYANNVTSSNLTFISLSQNRTIEVNLSTSYTLHINTINYTGHVDVSILSGNALINVSNEISLPKGNYNLRVNFTKFMNGEYYNYYANKTIHLNGNMTVNINIERRKIQTHLYGEVMWNDIYASNTVLELISLESEKKNVTLNINNGYYDGYITPGRYLLYVSYLNGEKKFANVSSVNISGKDLNLNILLQEGYTLSGGIYLNNIQESIPVKIYTHGGYIKLSTNGFYSIILPAGHYEIYAQTTQMEYGLNISYTFSKDVAINSDTNMDIMLHRVTHHNININVISGDKIAAPNSTLGLLIKVRNDGNIVEHVRFEGVQQWRIENSPHITLYPNQEEYVNFMVKVPATIDLGSQSMELRALYSSKSTDFYFTTNITAFYSTSTNSTLIGWDNNSIVYEIKVKNDGNTPMNYTIGALNAMELENKGWNVKLFVGGKESKYLNVSAHSQGKFVVKITTIRENPSSTVPAMIYVSGEKVHTVKLSLEVPRVSTILYVKGNNTENYTGTSIPSYYYALWGVAIGIGIALVIIGRRRK